MNSDVLVKMYLEYRIPCDQLVSDPNNLVNFTDDYNQRVGQNVEPAYMGKTLLNLRRKGQKNGGLPRLMRKYYGRNINN